MPKLPAEKSKPQRQHADETRRKILDAARRLFVEHGYAGTSMGKIASLAAVNHSLIFHHFGNKQKLWLAVKVDIVDRHTGESTRLPSVDQPFPDFLRALVEKNSEFYLNQDLMRMLGWQRLETNDDIALGAVYSEELQRWVKGFEHYQRQGDIAVSLKIPFVITMVLGILTSAAMDRIVFTTNPTDKAEYYDFIVDRLLVAFAS